MVLNPSYYVSMLIIGLGVAIFFYFIPGDITQLPKKSLIDLETRYVLAPSWKKKHKHFIVNIQIESYQNPQALNLDFSEHILLEDQLNHLYDVKKWKVLSENAHRTRAKIWFKLNSKSKHVVLRIFGLNNYEFNWSLEPHYAK